MKALKKILFHAYGGFADQRIKDLDKSNRFIVDDRDESDFGANKKLFSYFCMIFAEVKSNDSLKVNLYGNIPVGKDVERWLAKNNCEIKNQAYQSMLSVKVDHGNQDLLTDLADAIAGIVSPGAPRYKVNSYKYVCPRTAKSLRRLKKVLDDAWASPLPSDPKGLFY